MAIYWRYQRSGGFLQYLGFHGRAKLTRANCSIFWVIVPWVLLQIGTSPGFHPLVALSSTSSLYMGEVMAGYSDILLVLSQTGFYLYLYIIRDLYQSDLAIGQDSGGSSGLPRFLPEPGGRLRSSASYRLLANAST